MLALTDSALAPLYHLRHGPRPDRRRALELLAASRDGATKALLRAHGLTIAQRVSKTGSKWEALCRKVSAPTDQTARQRSTSPS